MQLAESDCTLRVTNTHLCSADSARAKEKWDICERLPHACVRNVEIFLVRVSNSFLSRCSQRFCVKRRGNSHLARRSTPRETYLLCVKSLSLVCQSPPPFWSGREGGRTKAWASGARPLKLENRSWWAELVAGFCQAAGSINPSYCPC